MKAKTSFLLLTVSVLNFSDLISDLMAVSIKGKPAEFILNQSGKLTFLRARSKANPGYSWIFTKVMAKGEGQKPADMGFRGELSAFCTSILSAIS